MRIRSPISREKLERLSGFVADSHAQHDQRPVTDDDVIAWMARECQGDAPGGTRVEQGGPLQYDFVTCLAAIARRLEELETRREPTRDQRR